jgi:hypothetical protein
MERMLLCQQGQFIQPGCRRGDAGAASQEAQRLTAIETVLRDA